jgi:hypothetical protein
VFKNFYRALDYYVDSDKGGQKLNLSYLVNNSDGLRELGPLVELQTYSSFFITAFHEALELNGIPYKNHFESNNVDEHAKVLVKNQDYIRQYVSSGKDNYEVARYAQ